MVYLLNALPALGTASMVLLQLLDINNLYSYNITKAYFNFSFFSDPIFLIVVNILLIKMKNIKWYVSSMSIVLFGIINGIFKYLYWGTRGGDIFNPDAETQMWAIYYNTVFPIIIACAGVGILTVIVTLIRKHIKRWN